MKHLFDQLRYYAGVTATFSRLAIQRQLEYPLFLVSWIMGIPIQYFGGIWLLKVLVDTFQPLAGWGFPQIAFLYGLALLSHGLQVFLFIQTWQTEFYITEGQFDRMLVRPMNVFFQFCATYINFIGLIDLVPGIVIFAIGCKLTGFVWTAASTMKLVLVVAGGTLLRAGVYTILSSTAFWTMRSWPLISAGQMVFQRGSFYPITIYPQALQLALTFVFPAAFISFYPACDLLGMNAHSALPLGFALWTPVVGVAVFALSQFVFNIGLSRYESAGS